MRASRCGVTPPYTTGRADGGAGAATPASGTFSGGGGVGSCARAAQRSAAITEDLVLAGAAAEAVVPIAEEDVEGGQRAVAAGDVPLQRHRLRVGELGVGGALLLQHAQPI